MAKTNALSPKLGRLPHQPLLTGPLTVLFLLALLATLIYSNTFSASFHLDDAQVIVANPKIGHLENFFDLSGSRSVGYLTFALNYRFGGFHVFGYHLVNLLIHITNGFLVYSLSILLFRASLSRQDRASWISFAAALLFIAHPIQTQAVTYIVQRFASLAALFYLLGVVGYLKWRLENRFLWYGIAIISTVFGMETKESVFTLPLMIGLIEAVFFWPVTKRRWAALIPFLMTLLIIPFSRLVVLGGAGQLSSETTLISRSDYLFTQFRVIVTYLRLLLLPIQQNLDYDYPVYHSLFAPPVFVSVLFLSAFFALAVCLLIGARVAPSSGKATWRLPLNAASRLVELRLIAFGIFWFFLTLFVESSIIPIQDLIFEHRVYLPSAGIFLSACAAWGLVMVSARRKLIGLLSMGVIIVIFSAATYQRNQVWRDETTLCEDVIRKSPIKARPHNNLGNAYRDQRRLEEAVREYQTAIQLQPDYAIAHNNLGIVYSDQGHFEEAIREYQTAIQLEPSYAMAHTNLGNAYGGQGQLKEAIREYQAALSLQPDYAGAHYNLGVVYAAQGNSEEAIREYQATIQLQPDNAIAHNNLGVVYSGQRRLEEAIREYQTAVRLQPDNAAAHNNLGADYSDQGHFEEAIREYETALQLQPDFPQARQALDALKAIPPINP